MADSWSRFSFPVDAAHYARCNASAGTAKKMAGVAVGFGVVQCAVAVAMLALGGFSAWAWVLAAGLVMGAVASFVVARSVPGKLSLGQDVYDRYPLCPAVVVGSDAAGVTLCALVDAATDAADGPRRALAVGSVKSLGLAPADATTDAPAPTAGSYPSADPDGAAEGAANTAPAVGVRVPCVAVGRMRNSRSDNFDAFTLVPISWGTTDPTVIRRANKAVPAHLWQLLKRHQEKTYPVMAAEGESLRLL